MKLNISIDDVSPHQKASTKVLSTCHSILEKHPSVKFTLFVPVAYWRTMNYPTKTALFIHEYPSFCDTLKNLPTSNFEIGYHGYYHGIPGKSDNDEFQSLSKAEAKEKFLLMKKYVQMAKLDTVFKPIFRPPAWRMSAEAITAAREEGYRVLALSSQDYAKQTYRNRELERDDVVYWTCCPPAVPLAIHEKNELVYHACEWDKNFLSQERADELIEWLNSHPDIEHTFIEGIL